MAKQTAVQYFDEQIQERIIVQDVVARKMIIEISMEDYINIKKQAKEMENKQIISAWMATDNELQRIAAEKYYNETYDNK